MAVKMPDLVAYGERVNKTQNNSGGVQMPNLVAYGKRAETRKVKETKAVTPSASPRPMENASTGNSRPNSRLLADVRTGGTTPPSLDNGRVGKVISGAAKSTGSAFTNLGGLMAEGAGYLNTRIANQNAGASLQSDHDAVKRYEKMLRDVKWANGKAMTAADVKQVQGYLASAKRRIAAHEGYTKAVERSDKAVADKAYQKADRLSQSSAADVAQAKEGLGPVGQFAVDVGVAGAQMAGDMAVGALTGGSALPAMFVRSVGSAAQEARQSGASYGQQLGYGLGSGALSVATEKISNVADPFKKVFGEGLADKAAGKLIARFGESDAVRIMKRLAETPGGKAALSFISEGGEEAIEDIAQPILQTIYNGKRYSTVPEYIRDLDAKEIAHDALVGGALGLVGSAAENVQRAKRSQQDAQPTQEARPEVQEGTYTPAPANAPEGTQNAAPSVETATNKGETVQIVERLRESIPGLNGTEPVSTVSSKAIPFVEGRTMAEKARKMFEAIKGVVSRPGFGDIDINGRSVKDDLSHGVGAAKAAVIPAIPEVLRRGQQIDFQQNWKGRPYDGYVFAAPVTMDGETAYVAAVVKRTSKNRFYLHEVIDANGHVIKIDAGDRANPTSLAANGDAGTQSQASADLSPVTNADVGPAPTASVVETTPVEGTRLLNANDSIAQGTENVKNGGAAGFDGLGNADAGTVNTPFDTMQAQSEEFHPVNPNSAERVRNDQRRAPSEVPVVNPDTGRNVEKTVSTILNSPLTSPEMASVYENAIAHGKFDYDVVTDQSAVGLAQAKLDRDGLQETATKFIAMVDMGQRITKWDMGDAINAYNRAVTEGDSKTAFDLTCAIASAAHDSAQVVQAMNLMNRLTPEGRLLTLRRLVDRMNDRAARQNRTPRQSTANSGDVEGARVDYIDKVTGFTLSDELATNYLMAETDAERAAAWDAITTSIADQIPSTFREKANFWRYTSMLTNPTTHIRNIMGNAIQFGARKIKNGIGAAIERAVIKDQSQRTKALSVDKDLKAFARSQYDTDQNAAMGSGKYSDATTAGIEQEIRSKRKMFQGEDIFSRAIQGLGDLNSRALDYEDVIFNRAAYVDSFAQALQAKGVTAAEAHAGTRSADVEAARAYAIEEAQRATYRNTTALSEALSKLGRYEGDNPVKRAGSFVADALFPFRKTPANILATGLDYSPIGLGKGIKEAMFDVKSGKCTAADAVDSIASGLTGTGLLVLGAYMAAEGFFGATLHVRAGDDDKEEDFEKSMGGQDYAIQIGDKSYSLDWAVPAAMPLFAGAAIMESAQKGGGTFDAVADALLGMQDVVLETSMLSSLNDLIANISYADSPVLYIADKAISSYAGQYIPTVGSKIASTLDDTVRKSYVEKGTGQLSSDVNYFLQGAAKKVPGVRNQLQPSIDLWGNEVSNGSAPERVLQSFISPGYFKTQDNSPATQEVRRLAKATGESGVYPAAAEKSFMVNGETKYLTGEEYTKYAKTMGSTRKQIIENMLKSKGYQKLSDDDKAKAISYAYEYAKVKGKQAVSSYKPSNSSFSKGALASVLPPDMYILYKVTADKDNNGSVTSVESAQALKDLTGLTDSQRGKAWAEKNSTTKPEKNPFTGALVEAGASVSTSISVLDKYRELYNAEGMKPKEKAADFRAYVYGLGLTPSQIAAAQSTYTFFGSYPIEW